jgi:hypothetical protein
MAKFTVKSKSEGFKGSRLGIPFIQGVASFDDENLVPLFEDLGYEVEGKEEKPKPKTTAKKTTTRKKATTKKED